LPACGGSGAAISRDGAAEISDLKATYSESNRDQGGGGAMPARATSGNDGEDGQSNRRHEDKHLESEAKDGTDQKRREREQDHFGSSAPEHAVASVNSALISI